MVPRVLILHSDPKSAESAKEILNSSGYQCRVASGFDDALPLLDSTAPHLVLIERRSADSVRLCATGCGRPVVVVATFDALGSAVCALMEHAAHVATGQADADRKLLQQSLAGCRTPPPPSPTLRGIVGQSPILKEALDLVRKAAASEASIFLFGESGTGKELAAKAIHADSSRSKQPLVEVDCASLPEGLLEAELFGCEKGAFTGAMATKPGLMELAHRGTLFLDEIGEMPISLQAKLLRALQEKKHRRVGGLQTINFDVRVISATSCDLSQHIREGKFREDLMFRLNVIPIRLPALRERVGDVPLLANYFLETYCEIDTGSIKLFDSEVLEAFERYSWPGNIRELQNVVRRMCILAEGNVIGSRDLPEELMAATQPALPPANAPIMESGDLTFMEAKRRYLDLFECAYARDVLERHEGNVSRAADAAGIDRKTFYRILRKHQLQPCAFRNSDSLASRSRSLGPGPDT